MSEASIQSTPGSRFKKVYWSKKDTIVLESESSSVLKCLHLCVNQSDSGASNCSGFHFDSSTSTCKMFQGTLRGVDWVDIQDPSTDLIYRKAIECLGFHLYGEHSQFCLGAFPEPLTKSEAADECNKHGGNLIDLDVDEKYDIMDLLWKNVMGLRDRVSHIGGSDEEVEGKFVFGVSGKPMNALARWATGMPDNGFLFLVENCVTYVIPTAGLNDVTCDFNCAYTCEILL